ncbi:MAG TPA: type II secretion system protein N [Candidatus Binataceae bacterium]|nr:type II secretion system protein N [Candidatus Binataceae bacterium]
MELRLTERHIVALNFMLGALLAYFGVLAAGDVIALRRQGTEAAPIGRRARIAKVVASDQSRASYQAIVERDLFNIAPPPAPPPAPVVEDLHLTLIGVSTASKGKPFAIVANERGEQSVFRVGEMIPDSGKLLEVDKDRAIVDHGGRRVILELPKEDMASEEQQPTPGVPIYRHRMSAPQASNADAMSHYRQRMGRRFGGHQE